MTETTNSNTMIEKIADISISTVVEEQQQQLASSSHPAAFDSAACRSSSFAVGDFDPTKAQQLGGHSENSEGDNIDNSTSSHYQHCEEDDLDNLIPVDERLPHNRRHAGQHPELRSVCVMDCHKEDEIVPNDDQAFHLENECFVGKVMLLMRTPDVDNHRDPNILGPVQREVSEYFKGKKRRYVHVLYINNILCLSTRLLLYDAELR